jgi:transposase
LPADLPRVERIVACTAEQSVCQRCGNETAVIGYDASEMLDVEPARYFVQVTKREKRACKRCEDATVATAPIAPRIIEKSLVSDRIIIDTILDKYTAHLPLYRQSALLERDCGIGVSRSTMDGWVMRVGELLVPVVGAMREELLAGSYIQADETPVDVQMHDNRGKNHQAYLWQYGVPGGSVVFDFRMGRAREGPKSFLDKFDLSNNLAENSMRGVALGRKNWIHIGSQQAGPQGSGNPVSRGELPQNRSAYPRIPSRGPARTRQLLHPKPGATDPGSLRCQQAEIT